MQKNLFEREFCKKTRFLLSKIPWKLFLSRIFKPQLFSVSGFFPLYSCFLHCNKIFCPTSWQLNVCSTIIKSLIEQSFNCLFFASPAQLLIRKRCVFYEKNISSGRSLLCKLRGKNWKSGAGIARRIGGKPEPYDNEAHHWKRAGRHDRHCRERCGHCAADRAGRRHEKSIA